MISQPLALSWRPSVPLHLPCGSSGRSHRAFCDLPEVGAAHGPKSSPDLTLPVPWVRVSAPSHLLLLSPPAFSSLLPKPP